MTSLLFKMINFALDHISATFIAIAMIFVYRNLGVQKKNQKKAREKFKKAEKDQSEPLTLHPVIDPKLCAGCGACTRVCPEGDILQLVNNKAVLVSPTKCVGHGECEVVCPFDALKLVVGTKTRGLDIPRVNKNYETNVPGLYIAGELGGMGLIRNAIKQGVMAAQHALANLNSNSQAQVQYDLLIVGAGPAGFSAGLEAIKQKKSYLLIEQDSFGGAVYHFPRQKIVMSHPFQLPIIGATQFPANKVSKEGLLKYWEDIRLKTHLKVTDHTKFEALEKLNDHFKVTTSKGVFTARKVILALGVRGTPRKLGVPGELASKVTYNLIDPEQYQGKSIVVVGGGNSGVEAAQMLGNPKWKNRVHLLVRSAVFDRCNEENMNKIMAMEKKGYVKILFESSVTEISESKVKIKVKEDQHELENDFVFVFAGAEMPHKFLMSLGIQIDKKFGESLGA